MSAVSGRRVALVALLVAVVATPAVVVGQAGSGATFTGGLDPDAVVMAVDLRADGSATWRVEYRVRLTDDNETEAFESVRADVESNPENYTRVFADRIRKTVEAAEDATGRPMSAGEFAVTAEIRQLPGEYGVVTYTFAWEGFAVADGTTIDAGDTLEGFFLDSRTRLVVTWPDGYRATVVVPEPDERGARKVSWSGPVEFTGGEPRVSLSSAPSPTATTVADADGEDGEDGESAVALPVVLAVLGAAAALAGAFWWRRGRGASATTGDETTDLLSNEERVLALLDEHGGRVKQRTVAEETGWTEAKTSQVVGRLRKEGRIETFRLGRENVLALPDESDT